MQLNINIKLNESCTLPISYHHILQSAIYALIGGNLHDVDYKYDKRGYKLFTFGPIEGKYKIKGKSITFYDDISFEVRCFIDEIGFEIVKNITLNGIRLMKKIYRNVEVKVRKVHIEDEDLIINMKSPICVYETTEDKQTIYYNPGDEQFYDLVMDNFIRKYSAVHGKLPERNINLFPVNCGDKDKYLTHYKGFVIEAWKGMYRLSGEREHLQFLYDVGIGSKNSQGFGMFEVVD